MTEEQTSLQIGRIEHIQAQLRQMILEESLDGLNPLLEEMRSRLWTLLPADGMPGVLHQWQGQAVQRLMDVLATDRELKGLIQDKLKVVGNRLRKARQSRHAVTRYAVLPARANSQLMRSTDIAG